jgi:signal transduction histidine kinase
MNRLPAIAAVLLSFPAAAVEVAPYRVDASTLHLWHLDEAASPCLNAVANSQPLNSLFNGAKLGAASLDGFGACLDNSVRFAMPEPATALRGPVLLAAPSLDQGPADNVGENFRYHGPDGAFTFEAMVKFDRLPSEWDHESGVILSMDDDDDGVRPPLRRVFNFRIERNSFLSFFSIPGSGPVAGAFAAIPDEGPHAINTRDWFHVAVTYNGNEGAPDNLRLYWTRITPEAAAAHEIGTGTMEKEFTGANGDLAIGNEARGARGNHEGSPFPGWIDEVRISSIARDAGDFIFRGAAPEKGRRSAAAAPDGLSLRLDSILIDGVQTAPPPPGRALVLDPGLHRLDFDFSHRSIGITAPVGIRHHLDGLDDRWHEASRGMAITCQFLGADGAVLSQSQFPALGRSRGWESNPTDSRLTRRREPLLVPTEARKLAIIVGSGSPGTTGILVIDDLSVGNLARPGAAETEVWQNGGFDDGDGTTRANGVPRGWLRRGTDSRIARMVAAAHGPALVLADGDQSRFGEWISVQELDGAAIAGKPLSIGWSEAFSVIGGSQHRASHVNVPAGDYRFQVVAATSDGPPFGAGLELDVVVRPAIWQRDWFKPTLAAIAVAASAAVLIAGIRRSTSRRLTRVRLDHAVELERSRLARDLHDDLGTIVTGINLSASLAERSLATNPVRTSEHLLRIKSKARDLVRAMDEMVWAIDPTHDTLDHLGVHLAGIAEEVLRDSGVQARIEIPTDLPDVVLGSDFRHHLSLAVKEALHNVVRHAAPCRASLKVVAEPGQLRVTVADTGPGFIRGGGSCRHGLRNLEERIGRMGGKVLIASAPGSGTIVEFLCPLNPPPVREP